MSERSDPAYALARGFARHLATLSRRSGAPAEAAERLEQAALAISLASSAGSVCIHLSDLHVDQTIDQQALRQALLASNMLSLSNDASQALVIDEEDRLYLHRYFDYERRLAKRLLQPYRGIQQAIHQPFKTFFEKLFHPNKIVLQGRTDWQQLAVALAVNRGFTLISGGPGTGKTSSILNLIRCAKYIDRDCRVVLAAPTGKAASRMLEALVKAAQGIGSDLEIELPKEAFTVHRLLGAARQGDRFHYDREHLLPLDLLIVDEASMLDLALTVHLIEATPSTARIVFLGDKDQLAAVEAGAVFAELSANPSLSETCLKVLEQITGIDPRSLYGAHQQVQAQPSDDALEAQQHDQGSAKGLGDAVIWLRENFRFNQATALGELIDLVNSGQAEAVIARLRQGRFAQIDWLEDENPELSEATKQSLLAPFEDYVKQLRDNHQDLLSLFDQLGRYKILCAIRDGPRGVERINQLVSEMIHGRYNSTLPSISRWFVRQAATQGWYPGQCIMVLRNDYVLGRFNGDIGIVMPHAQQQALVYFSDGLRLEKAIGLSRLPDHETAFALTVHKAQGSEFDRVAIVLPSQASPVVNKALLYTAISRARASVSIIASEDVLRKAITTPSKRHSGIRSRIAAQIAEASSC